GGGARAWALARRRARAGGIDRASVTGTGPGGRIIKRDVEAAVAAPAAPAAAAPGLAAPAFAPVAPAAEVEDVPVTQMRKTIAKRLVTSIGPDPSCYLTIEVDMWRAMDLRKTANER